jgi:hypothetical protein
MKQFLKEVAGVMLGVLIVLAGLALVGCAKPEPEPPGMSDWRRCASECPYVFILDFGTDPPTCRCTEVPW